MLLAALVMMSGPPLTVTVEEASIPLLERGGVGPVTVIVRLHNTSDKPISVGGRPADALPEAGKRPVAQCAYDRALSWETQGKRSKFTAFNGQLESGEKLLVKLFYRWPLAAAEPRDKLRLSLTLGPSDAAVKATSAPTLPTRLGGL